MKPDADVYQGDRLVAHLRRIAGGTSLEFLPDVKLERGQLSSRLVYSRQPIESADLHPFFLNLLPEGARLRLLLEAARSKDDSLALLMKTGWDSIGDVAVLPHGHVAGEHNPAASPRRLNEVSFWDLFYEGVKHPFDAAVPGVQEKVSAATVAFGVRLESIPSAILKLNPERFPRLVQNEHFFLRMAKACGIPAAKASIVEDRLGEVGLLVERFDRVREGKTVRKLHQEDACQLLDVVPAHKYNLAMREIAGVIADRASAPIVEITRLLQLYAFSYLVGNSDLHGKNISLYWRGPVTTLTPAYDLLSTLPYPSIEKRMALRLDGKDDNLRGGDFVRFAAGFGIPERPIHTMVRRLCDRAEPWIGALGEIGFDDRTTAALQRAIKRRLDNLRR